ncbi:MAG TPA: 2'-5' RNA ligase family protein [Pseudonocardiaceae bacterium]|jgi:2'-5' RNA ligase|nr:2'-5' RNA ligase family protein [Pseudonocardiaceae bacterium]
MARLFSAFVPPEGVLRELARRLAGWGGFPGGATPADGDPEPAGRALRWSRPARWHITLGFFGDHDDPARRTAWLRQRLADLPAPRLRLAGSGTFPGVLWAGLDAADPAALHRVAVAAGADQTNFRPHLTLAMGDDPAADRSGRPAAPLTGYTGQWFVPDEVSLMSSARGQDGPEYHTIERIPLVR